MEQRIHQIGLFICLAVIALGLGFSLRAYLVRPASLEEGFAATALRLFRDWKSESLKPDQAPWDESAFKDAARRLQPLATVYGGLIRIDKVEAYGEGGLASNTCLVGGQMKFRGTTTIRVSASFAKAPGEFLLGIRQRRWGLEVISVSPCLRGAPPSVKNALRKLPPSSIKADLAKEEQTALVATLSGSQNQWE